MVYCTPYFATYVAPTAADLGKMVSAAKRIIPGRGVAWCLFAALGPLLGVTHAPRHPAVVAISARMASVLCDGRISPSSFVDDQAWWDRAVGILSLHAYFGDQQVLGAHHLLDPIMSRSDIFECNHECERELFSRIPASRLGCLLYHVAWIGWALSNAGAKLWDLPARRTWWVTTGGEWSLFNNVKGFACAYFPLQVLGGGLRDRADTCSSRTRGVAPRRVGGCGSCEVAYCWATSAADRCGYSLCNGFPTPHSRSSLPDRVAAAVAPQLMFQEPVDGDDVFSAGSGDCMCERSSYGACPLCAIWQYGVEHIVLWCPAVAYAWRQLVGDGVANWVLTCLMVLYSGFSLVLSFR